MISDWVINEMAEGAQKLLTQSLPGTPASELIEGTVMVWAEAFCYNRKWEQTIDQHRLREAFLQTCALAERWPSLKQIMDHMPQRLDTQKLPEPELTREQKAENRARIRELLQTIQSDASA